MFPFFLSSIEIWPFCHTQRERRMDSLPIWNQTRISSKHSPGKCSDPLHVYNKFFSAKGVLNDHLQGLYQVNCLCRFIVLIDEYFLCLLTNPFNLQKITHLHSSVCSVFFCVIQLFQLIFVYSVCRHSALPSLKFFVSTQKNDFPCLVCSCSELPKIAQKIPL